MVMHASTSFDSPSFSPLGDATARTAVSSNLLPPPPLTSGFGTVMEHEEDIQSSTEEYLGADKGPNSAAIDRILQYQAARLGANIALLEQRYETLPHPGRFQILQAKHNRLSAAHPIAGTGVIGTLRHLIVQHLNLLRKIETLIGQRPDGQRAELILAEMVRNHEEMAWMLTALIKEDDSVRDMLPIPIIAAAAAASKNEASEANWENEGGA